MLDILRVGPGWNRSWRCQIFNAHFWENRLAQAAIQLRVGPLGHCHSLHREISGSGTSEKKEFCRKSGDQSFLYQGPPVCP